MERRLSLCEVIAELLPAEGMRRSPMPQVVTLGESEGEHAKAKFRRILNPDALLTFPLTYSMHNRILESPALIHCVRNVYDLGYTH